MTLTTPSTIQFRALSIAPELPVRRLAEHFGVKGKLAWDEPVSLAGDGLRGVLTEPAGREVFLFAFGSIVFLDCAVQEINDVLKYLGKVDAAVRPEDPFRWSEEFALEVRAGATPAVDSERMTVAEGAAWLSRILATVLAKSVALERVEAKLETALDRAEQRVEALEKGRLDIADRKLAEDAARTLRIEHESVHYVGLLDRPDATWADERMEAAYDSLSRAFELEERLRTVHRKTQVLKDIDHSFTELAHARRAARLEWIIIGLFVLEIAIPVVSWLARAIVGG